MEPSKITVRTFELIELRLLTEPEDAIGAEAASAWRSSASEWMSVGSGV
jgi:hypothetical protein